MPKKEERVKGEWPISYHLVEGWQLPCRGEYNCIYCGLVSQLIELQNVLVGRVLTVIDGCVTNETQNKAIKDIARQSIYDAVENHRPTILWSVSNFVEDEYKNDIRQAFPHP